MQANCPKCSNRIAIDDAKVPDRAFNVKCPKCQAVVRFPGKGAAPAAAPPPAAPAAAAPPASEESFEPPPLPPAGAREEGEAGQQSPGADGHAAGTGEVVDGLDDPGGGHAALAHLPSRQGDGGTDDELVALHRPGDSRPTSG